MTYQNLKEYCETQYKKPVEMNKKKQTCPVCGHKTFCLYGENLEKGKCFHPECGLHLNLNVINYGVDYKIIVAERASKVFHDYLFTIKENNNHLRAYDYAVNDRKINELILRRSDVGAIPKDYDVKFENEDLINSLNEQIEKEPDNKEKNKLKQKLDDFVKFIDSFQTFIENNSFETLIFFNRDEHSLITQIKARKAYLKEKRIQTFKVQKKSGVFNFNLFSADEMNLKTKKKIDKSILVFEGEFDQLSFATWAMENVHPIQSCALSGANGDLKTALNLTTGNICIFYDNDEAGKSVLDNAKDLKSVYGVTTPEPYKDIDEYINSFKDKKECHEAVVKLLNGAKLYLRELSGIKRQINSIINYDRTASNEKCQVVTLIILKELLVRGKLYRDNNYSYIFLNDNKRIIPIEDKNEDLKRLLIRMGVNAAREYYRYVVNEIATYAYDYGTRIETHDFCHYDSKNNTLYISNNDKSIYKITTDSIQELENGDEGIMFNYKPDYEPFELVKYDENRDYFKDFITDSMNIDEEMEILNKEEQAELVRLWFFSTFFHSIMPSKVILVAHGLKGSGKTSTLRRLGIILFGSNYNVTPLPNQPEDFDTVVTNNHFVILDNIDGYKPWLNDKLASIATGQTLQKRKLYTDNENLKFKTRTFLGLTSRTPKFTREDVADRLIRVPFKRIEEFIPESKLIKNILENRNEIMSYIIHELQKILIALEATKDRDYKTKFRIADFAIFGLRINDVAGRKEEFVKILDKVCEVQKQFATECDPLVYALKIFAKRQCIVQEYSGEQLYSQLLLLTGKDEYNFPEFKDKYKSTISFTRRLSNIKDDITKDVLVTTKEIRSNQKVYTVELVDKDFELPLTQNELLSKIDEKSENLKKYNNKGGKNE